MDNDIKRSKAAALIMSAVFISFTALFTLGTFFSKDREFSEMENRPLKTKPELSGKEILSGELDDEFEEYMSDQIFLKDLMMSFKTSCDYFSGKTFQNGVYFGKDGYLLQRFDLDEQNLTKNISYINGFVQKLDIPADMILAPTSVCVNADKLPAAAVTDDQREAAEIIRSQLSGKVTLFDAYDTLSDIQKNEGIQAYFRTDHHWTASGARAVCDRWLISAGLAPTSGAFKYKQGWDFYGTLYSKAPAGFVKPDSFGYFENDTIDCEVNFVNEKSVKYSLFDESFLEKKDKYAMYFGGNFAQMKITTSFDSGKKLLVLKDSYANSLIPCLIEQFSEIYVIDLRYFHFDKVSDVIQQNGIDRLLMVYNIDFINEDKNFIWLE